jgi:hypothetical protein
MKSFTKPAKLDGEKLIQELDAAGITVKANGLGVKCPAVDGDGFLWLDIAAKDEASASAVVANHQG